MGYLSLGTMTISVEPGRLGSFASRNTNSKGDWGHLSLGIMILQKEPGRQVICL